MDLTLKSRQLTNIECVCACVSTMCVCVCIDSGCVQEYKETPESKGSTAAPLQPINCGVSVNITHTHTQTQRKRERERDYTLLLNLLLWIPDTGCQEGAVFQLKL